jgi:tetratricopeptide (TPR) repeat protein
MATTYSDLMQSALAATTRDALDESEALCLQAMALEPGASMPYFLRATNFAHAGNYELAEACYTACLTRSPDFAIARFQLGLMQVTGGRPALGQATWELLLTLPADHYLRLFAQGLMSLLGHQFDQARATLERGIALNQENLPLNGDMQGVLDRLKAGEASLGGGTGQPEPAAADVHFLIGAYRQ